MQVFLLKPYARHGPTVWEVPMKLPERLHSIFLITLITLVVSCTGQQGPSFDSSDLTSIEKFPAPDSIGNAADTEVYALMSDPLDFDSVNTETVVLE